MDRVHLGLGKRDKACTSRVAQGLSLLRLMRPHLRPKPNDTPHQLVSLDQLKSRRY
jgi:hypothetical protein